MSQTMKRWQMAAIGRNHLELAEVPIPEVEAGEVLVRVHAVSLSDDTDGALVASVFFNF